MKKFSFLMCAIALMSLCFTSCKKNNNGNLDNVVEDGFYVYGPATAIADMKADNAALGLMGAGINEATKERRAGLYEKYVALEGGKEFTLALYEKNEAVEYGANLVLGEPYDAAYGVTIEVYKGKLEQNVKMTVPESGFYHIALDLNVANDLPEACIIVAPVEWELNANPDLKLVPSEFNKTHMTWTLADQEKRKGDKYKYAYGNGWKIKLTPAAEILIETNLGEGMQSGAADIVLAHSGKYDFKLEWNLAGGAIEKSFRDNTVCTEEYPETLPDHVYMIGQFCGWSWDAAFDMVPVHSHDKFWAVKFLNAGEGFKFCNVKEWSGDFTKLVNGVEGATEDGGNLVVAETGLYMVIADYEADKIIVAPAKIFGMGNCFGSGDAAWTTGEYAFNVAADGTASIVTANAGELRMYAEVAGADWWQSEFIILGGEIVYRGSGDDQERVNVDANKTIVLDFNAGTGAIQ